MNLLISIAAIALSIFLAGVCTYLFMRTRKLQKTEFQAPVRPYLSPEMVADDDISVTGNLLCDNHQAICDSLMEYVEKEKPYLNPSVKIIDVADYLNTNKSYLSKIINAHFRKNFSQFINWYRVRDAMDLFMRNPTVDIQIMARKSCYINDSFLMRYYYCFRIILFS